MKKAAILTAAGGAFLLLSALTSANAFDLKPGLWEMTNSSQASGTPPISDSMMANLTPEQRQQMMAAMQSVMHDPTPHTYQRCLTPDQVNDPLALNRKDSDDCTSTILSKTSNSESVRLVCTGDMPSTVLIKWRASTPRSASGTYQVTTGGGSGMNIQGNVSAKWLKADCGDVQ